MRVHISYFSCSSIHSPALRAHKFNRASGFILRVFSWSPASPLSYALCVILYTTKRKARNKQNVAHNKLMPDGRLEEGGPRENWRNEIVMETQIYLSAYFLSEKHLKLILPGTPCGGSSEPLAASQVTLVVLFSSLCGLTSHNETGVRRPSCIYSLLLLWVGG